MKRVFFRVKGVSSLRDGTLVRLMLLGDTALVTTRDGRWLTVTGEQIA